MQRNEQKEGMGDRKNINNVLERLKGLALQTSLLIPFSKTAMMKMKAILFITFVTFEAELEQYSETSQTPKMEFSAKWVDSSKLLTIPTKCLKVTSATKLFFATSSSWCVVFSDFLFKEKIMLCPQDFYIFVKSTGFKICDVIIGIAI